MSSLWQDQVERPLKHAATIADRPFSGGVDVRDQRRDKIMVLCTEAIVGAISNLIDAVYETEGGQRR